MEVNVGRGLSQYDLAGFAVSFCFHCSEPAFWYNSNVIFPDISTAELPNGDLPDDIREDFDEARSILGRSPRGAAALLRLAIQKLCIHLGQPGKNINDDIKALVANGLSPSVQMALDSVRVIGNDAVHPGTIDLRDNRDTATTLFRLVNFVAAKMISEPKEVSDIFTSLPQSKRDAITKRDAPPT
ncbi:hypothetical protein C5Y96_15180 [Blastopirellula marina]|uniref:DUF4145 domain-containing protein n=1 Tax=Blastopirellula marina TaxID=124 RepID=A0A2S8FAB5_9BACT|nr:MULTISPECIES: DUF4145 domain-containing protein [Pirellulaceae]PQO29097.1 hypothetical protein C5Y96_15180 [Blastopirellula marina]RCS50288.1 DUF4145 domain-containing protein [Bremerella cremea]